MRTLVIPPGGHAVCGQPRGGHGAAPALGGHGPGRPQTFLAGQAGLSLHAEHWALQYAGAGRYRE